MLKKRAFRKLYHKYFYIPKHENITEKVFRSRMTVSLLTILACVAMLVSSAFAFFTMQVSTAPSTIAAANYTVRVNSATASAYTCRLAYDDMHLFELTAGGTASTGYCKVLIDDEAYYTQQIPQGDSLLLAIQAAQGTEIRFEPYWGQYATSGSAVRYVNGDEIFHSQTEHAVYTVREGATIADIAAHYGVAPEDICVYNGLSDDMIALFSRPSATPQQITFSIDTPLSAGLVLKIPGVPADAEPYIVPEEPEEDEDKDADEANEENKEDDNADETKEPERSDEPNAPEGDSDTEGSDTDVTNPDATKDSESEDTESEDTSSEDTSSEDTNTGLDAVKPEDAESEDTSQDAGEAEDADSDGTDSEQSDSEQTDAESADSGAADAVTSGSAYAFS